jgi:hypothetical protein
MAERIFGQKIDGLAKKLMRLQLDDVGGHELADTARRRRDIPFRDLISMPSSLAFVSR